MDSKPKVTVNALILRFSSRVAIYCHVRTENLKHLNKKPSISFFTRYFYRSLGWRLIDVFINIQSERSNSFGPILERMTNDCAQKKIKRRIPKVSIDLGIYGRQLGIEYHTLCCGYSCLSSITKTFIRSKVGLYSWSVPIKVLH